MELDEMKTTWNSMNDRLIAVETGQSASELARAARRLRWQPLFELGCAIISVVWSGGFLFDNFESIQRAPAGAVPAACLYALSIFAISLSVRQLLLISALDYANPVVEVQRSLAQLRSIRVRSAQFLMLIGIPLWVLLPLFLGQCLINYKFIFAVDGTWIAANLAFGVLVSGAIVLAARRLRTPFWQRVDDAIAGTEIHRAQALLKQVDAFSESSS